MASSIVFKVKHGETLRRFNVAISGDQQLDITMEGLRMKICSLFNFPLDADFRLTYEDEDDDLVTLVDDDDLQDVVRQGLDPVRISVDLGSAQSAQSSYAPSSRSATPNTPSLPNVQPIVSEAMKTVQETLNNVLLNLNSSTPSSQQSMNPDVAKLMKSVQEPLTQAFTKLSSDISSKAASTNPILAELFDGLSKMGQSYVNGALSGAGGVDTSVTSNNNVNNVGSNSSSNSEGSKHEGSTDQDLKKNGVDTDERTQSALKNTKATGVSESEKHTSCPPFGLDKGKKANCGPSISKKSSSCISKKNKDITGQKKGMGSTSGFLGAIPINGSEKESIRDAFDERIRDFQSYRDPVHLGECPFTGGPLAQMHNPNRGFSKADTLGSIFHKGVRCDGCGVLPITGPRFKSKVKYDYDLCSICFSRLGNDVDYTRIDFPLARGHFMPFKVPDAGLRHWRSIPHASKHLRSRLDSRFIMDVNVMDGTTMAPSTPFTKIWKMRNNGTLPWNHGLKLLWIGGDRFSSSDSVEIQVPAAGLDVGLELDVAVDFIAPELPGRYVSYWRMADLSGHKFGQRIWVQIQVDHSVDLTLESPPSPMLNLNLPPDSNETAVPEVADVKTEPGFIVEVSESSAPSILAQNFPTNDDLLVTASASSSVPLPPPAASPNWPVSPVGRSSVSYPEVGSNSNLIQEASASASAGSLPYPTIAELGVSMTAPSDFVSDAISNVEQPSEKTQFEDKLLLELSQMGFKQIDLNKEVLRKNEYDLERSVDDLCDVSEWDPILDELKEMGFVDKETNKKLLMKNNGSITRVVMDLIAEEKA